MTFHPKVKKKSTVQRMQCSALLFFFSMVEKLGTVSESRDVSRHGFFKISHSYLIPHVLRHRCIIPPTQQSEFVLSWLAKSTRCRNKSSEPT